jgi:hypothetical protein
VISALFLRRDDGENSGFLFCEEEYYFCHKAALKKEQD